MTLHERLSAIVGAMPDSGTVSLPVSELRAWLEEDGDVSRLDTRSGLADLTCEQIGEQLGRTPACVRGWCRAGKLAGYRLNGREWRIPTAAFQSFLEAERTRAPKPRRTGQAKPVDLGAWRNAS